MEESSVTNDVVLDVNKDVSRIITSQHSRSCLNVSFLQKLVAEAVGTYLLIFAGCASVVVNKNNNGIVTLPGVAITWGLTVTALVYSVGHISGGHFNPAVTIAFSSIGTFPFKQVPAYVIAQVAGSTLASGTLRLIFDGKHDQFPGTLPAGSNLQSFVLEFIITFFLMFVISGVATDSRATGEFAGIAVGFTVLLNVMIAGPVSGASINPARSIGPAFIHNEYHAIWIYLVAPTVGAVAGAWVYNTIRHTERSLR